MVLLFPFHRCRNWGLLSQVKVHNQDLDPGILALECVFLTLQLDHLKLIIAGGGKGGGGRRGGGIEQRDEGQHKWILWIPPFSSTSSFWRTYCGPCFGTRHSWATDPSCWAGESRSWTQTGYFYTMWSHARQKFLCSQAHTKRGKLLS